MNNYQGRIVRVDGDMVTASFPDPRNLRVDQTATFNIAYGRPPTIGQVVNVQYDPASVRFYDNGQLIGEKVTHPPPRRSVMTEADCKIIYEEYEAGIKFEEDYPFTD